MIIRQKYLLVVILILLVFFVPAYNTFFTNDDFFHLSVSQPGSIFSSFRLFPHFRPITTQIYYSISSGLFSNTPQILRLISLITLLAIGYQVYLLTLRISGSKLAAGISAFLYLTSATHYGHLNYAGAFHELGMTLFILGGCLSLWRNPKISVLFFVLALMSKETAVVYPALLILLGWYIPRLKINLLPHILILALYLLFRLFFFGFATGNSYLWTFSPKILNTLGWYGLWSFNLPEMWVDFIGPGLKLNPNLLHFWGLSTVTIFGLFCLLTASLIGVWIQSKKDFRLTVFSLLWFVFSLGPLLLLPWHKFTFYLTLPLVGLCIWLGKIMSSDNKLLTRIFLIIWVLLSVTTYSLTLKTNWITQGAQTAARFHSFFISNRSILSGKTLVFYDTTADSNLPWSPTMVLKDVLSDNNYFEVYSDSTVTAVYLNSKPDKITPNKVQVISRQFLGY